MLTNPVAVSVDETESDIVSVWDAVDDCDSLDCVTATDLENIND